MTETHYLRSEAKARQDKWLAADLRTLPRGTPVIVATHYPLRSEWFDQRKKEGINILCQLAAHWHVVQKGSRCGVPVLISAPARGNDWGAYSRAYRWISVTPEGLKSELRIAGQYRRLRIFSPAPQSPLGLRPMMLLAYDSARSVRSVTCRVTSPNGRSLLPKLLRSGDYSWLGEIDFDAPGVWNFQLEAADNAGELWKNEQKIQVIEERLAEGNPGEDFPWLLSCNPPRQVETKLTPPLKPLWITHTGSTHVLHASPAVVDEKIFVAVTDTNVGTPGSSVLCLDARNGKEIWRTKSPMGDMRGPVTAHDGRIFAITGEGWVAAYEVQSGRVLWSRPMRPYYEHGRPLAINQTPTVPTAHGLLVSDWQGPQFLMDYASGKTMVELKGNVGNYAAFAAVFEDVMYCARRGGSIAIRIPSGEIVWKAEEKARSTSAGIVTAGKFIYTSSSGVRALDSSTGKEVWTGKWSHAGYQNPVPVVWDDLVLANGTVMSGLDLSTGKRRFVVPHSNDPQRFTRSQRQRLGGSSTPVIAGGLAFYGHDDTSLRAIDKSGKVVWDYRLGTPIKTSPVVSGNLLFVHDLAGNLWCFVPLAHGN